jgi:hypothetical protein
MDWDPVLGCASSNERQLVGIVPQSQATHTSAGVGEYPSNCFGLLVGDRRFRKELILRSDFDFFRSDPIKFLRFDGLSLLGESLLGSNTARSGSHFRSGWLIRLGSV